MCYVDTRWNRWRTERRCDVQSSAPSWNHLLDGKCESLDRCFVQVLEDKFGEALFCYGEIEVG